jgi:polar amino acid transport system substrate-binding protein
VAKRVFEPAGHKVDYQILSWARAIEDARQGKFVGIIGAARRDAPDFVFPSEELGMSRTAFVVRKSDKWEFGGVDGLKGRTLGVIRDYSYSERLDAWVEANKANEQRIQVTSGDNALDLNLRKLQRGRIDTVMDGEWVLEYTLASLKLDKELRIAGADENADPVYIAFSPANPKSKEYAQLLAEGIARLRASGELAAILTKYGVNDWK